MIAAATRIRPRYEVSPASMTLALALGEGTLRLNDLKERLPARAWPGD